MDISIIVPLFNEDESLGELAAWIEKVMIENNFSYEIIMVDDGSNDNSWNVIETLSTKNPAIKGIKFRRNYGKSAALNVGFEAAKGEVIITMDADFIEPLSEQSHSSLESRLRFTSPKGAIFQDNVFLFLKYVKPCLLDCIKHAG